MARVEFRDRKNNWTWAVRVSKGTDKYGNTQYANTTFKYPKATMTKRKAEAQLQKDVIKFEEQVQKGINTEKITFQELSEKYLEHVKDNLKIKTYTTHKQNLAKINKYIGSIEIKSLKKADVQKFIDEMKKPYKTNTGTEKTLSPATIRDYGRSISCVLSYACQYDYIEHNFCIGGGLIYPRTTRKEDKAIPKDVLKAYMELIDSPDTPLKHKAFFYLALSTGARSGELAALSWDSVDFDNNEITLNENSQYVDGEGITFYEPKTTASNRVLKIPDDVMQILKDLRIETMKKQMIYGANWKRKTDAPELEFCDNHDKCNKDTKLGYCSKHCKMFQSKDRVFIQDNGVPMHPKTPYTYLRKQAKKHDLQPIKIHGLRHSAVSLMIEKHVPITQIASYVGHSSPAVTNAVYSHDIRKAEEAKSVSVNIIEEIAK